MLKGMDRSYLKFGPMLSERKGQKNGKVKGED